VSKKYLRIAIMSLFILAGLSGCYKNDYGTNPVGGSNSGTPPNNEVWLQGMAFTPGTITVSAGTTIKWTNKDNVTHTVTSGMPGSPDGIFDSGNMSNGATFSHTFNTKGTFQYYCIPHQSSMRGTVVVQ
jgi:plastocyanin